MDDHEPILDAMLEELLGGHTPPDLKARILRAHQAEQVATPPSPPGPGDAPQRGFPPIVAQRRLRVRRKNTIPRPLWSSVAIVLLAATTFLAWALHQRQQHLARNQPPSEPTSIEPTPRVVVVPHVVPQRTVEPAPASTAGDVEIMPEIQPDTQALADSSLLNEFDYENQRSPVFRREVRLDQVWDDVRLVAFTDQQLAAAWKEAEVDAAEELSDAEWFVRACQVLLGRNPSRAEGRSFVRRDRDRDEVVEALMRRGEFAAHWSARLADTLVGPRASAGSAVRDQLEAYLEESIAKAKPYDQLAFELITAVGSNDASRDDFNPAVNFLLAHQGVAKSGEHRQHKHVAATNAVAQTFLGKQLQCAQCHDHPVAEWSQDQYWQMASFFVQMRIRKLPLPQGSSRLLNFDFTGTQGTPSQAELAYRNQDGTRHSVYPVFLDGQAAASQSGLIAEFDRREALAKFIIRSDAFARAVVNRLWDQVFGHGFTYPADDLGAHNRASHPELLARLATEFKNSGYQLRSALRWMTLSSPFRRAAGESSQPELFHVYAKQDPLPASQSILRELTRHAETRIGSTLVAQAAPVAREVRDQDYRRYQARFNQLLDTSPGSVLARIAASPELSERDKIEHLFLTVLGRAPHAKELHQSRRLVGERPAELALQEIGSILVRSREFAMQR